MILIEPDSVYLQRHLDQEFALEVAAAQKAATIPPLPGAILDDPSEWDCLILDFFREQKEAVLISTAASKLVTAVKTYSREDRREAWKSAMKRIGLFLKLKVLSRHRRNYGRLSEMYRTRKPILPMRRFLA